MSSHDRLKFRSLKFLVVGAINTVLIYALYVALVYLGLHYNIALTIDYAIGILLGYYLNRHWTFAERKKVHNSFSKYLITYLAVYTVNIVALNLFVAFTKLGPIWGQIVALAIATIFSFSIQNYWVFRSTDSSVKHQTR